ncbi:hypothetical protein FGG08_004162 [Glutinoglossum americanum]|uniref:Uncharacterized protein n=1 Tax=Glutinoglossum americanum TaxID=1670608 RepID=A0A9P8I193_9PEZI|nr:hypothetical protein FGG08_004162 [Glutinoglossum americanum]
MKFILSVILSLAAVHGALSACNGDNCARAVTGTRLGPEGISRRMTDCVDFLRVTITPEPSTTTITLTADPSGGESGGDPSRRNVIEAREVTVVPTDIPVYASACYVPERYSSACSCAGITADTATAPTPTVTETVTV